MILIHTCDKCIYRASYLPRLAIFGHNVVAMVVDEWWLKLAWR